MHMKTDSSAARVDSLESVMSISLITKAGPDLMRDPHFKTIWQSLHLCDQPQCMRDAQVARFAALANSCLCVLLQVANVSVVWKLEIVANPHVHRVLDPEYESACNICSASPTARRRAHL